MTITPGAFHTLSVIEEAPFGLRLGDGSVVLPREQAPPELAVGERVEVFVYEDPQGRLIATAQAPKVRLHRFACLEVLDHNHHGVFMDWGLDKDLFVPRSEQAVPMYVGDYRVVFIMEDKSGRVMGTSRVRDHLDRDVSEVEEEQPVEILVYEPHERGMRVVVDNRWEGIIYNDEIYRKMRVGTRLSATVAKVRDDGKLDIRIRPRGVVATMAEGQDTILETLRRGDGFLALHDKSSPEAIKSRLQMSKKAFKRAVGNLLRAGHIRLEDGGIRLVEPD